LVQRRAVEPAMEAGMRIGGYQLQAGAHFQLLVS
jgi:hypothetical protein